MDKTGMFMHFTNRTARTAGHPAVFATACLVIVAWAASGPIFDFSEAWQLMVNSITTIVTFLMVFLIQSTQNRAGEAMQLKLDELIRASEGAHDVFLDLEELSESDLDRIKARYGELARGAREEFYRHLETARRAAPPAEDPVAGRRHEGD